MFVYVIEYVRSGMLHTVTTTDVEMHRALEQSLALMPDIGTIVVHQEAIEAAA